MVISEELTRLLSPPHLLDSELKAVAFLDSSYPKVDDLNKLKAASEDIGTVAKTLASRLSQSQSDLDSLLSRTRHAASDHSETLQGLSLLRHSIADELAYLSEVLVSSMGNEEAEPTLLEDIEALQRVLKELQSLKSYLQVIHRIVDLSERAVDHVRQRGTSAITPDIVTGFQSLLAFNQKLEATCASAQDESGTQTLTLVQFSRNICKNTWVDIKASMSEPLLVASEKIGWPISVQYTSISPSDRNNFEHAFKNLLALQNIAQTIGIVGSWSGNDGLYSIEALVRPIALRFKYHFDTPRQTNRIDKPEWYFTHMLNASHEHRSFMESAIQPILSQTSFRDINAWREFTRLLFPILTRKLTRTIPSILSQPSLLAHTIYQALSFDASLAEDGFDLSHTLAKAPQNSSSPKGISEVILGRQEWFEAWLQGEKEFSVQLYQDIIEAPDAWQIADNGEDDESDSDQLRTTISARRLKTIIEQVTDRYSPLPDFKQRFAFLNSIQLPILDKYKQRITSSLDAFETLSSALARAVPGSLASLSGQQDLSFHFDTGSLTGGTEGTQRLCKAILSAEYIEEAMQRWTDDLFFLELSTHMSSSSGVSSSSLHQGVFGIVISQYKELIQRAENIIIQQICGEVENALKPHLNATITSNADQRQDLSIAQTLVAPLALLSRHLQCLKANLSPARATSLYKRATSQIADHLLQRQILYRGTVSRVEATLIFAESELWIETCLTSLGTLGRGRERIAVPWMRFSEAAKLMSVEESQLNEIKENILHASDEAWQDAMSKAIGSCELSRDEIARLLRRRED